MERQRRNFMNLASRFESLVLSQCCGRVTWDNIWANVLQQELVTWPHEPNTNGRLALYLISNKKGQSLTHKAEDLLYDICDNFDCQIFVVRGYREF